jgi:predicted nucleic acid-binding protein
MSERIVINTDPLIALGKMQAFSVIEQWPYEFCCPQQVETELLNGVTLGHPVALPAWVTVMPLQAPLSPFASIALDDGEAAVIQLALEQQLNRVCIDETKGRRAALSVGLQVVGSLGLLGKAKTEGLITAARPLILQAQQNGLYYDANLVASFLQALGE